MRKGAIALVCGAVGVNISYVTKFANLLNF